MCGICAVFNDKKNNAGETVFTGLKKLEYRGYDSWGIVVKSENNNQIILEKHTGKIANAKVDFPSSSIAIGHTRWATHGGVTDYNAHPHLSCDRRIAIVHNGIVENYQEIKAGLKKKHHFLSETDSEVIVHLIEEKLEKNSLAESAMKSFNQLIGSNAFVIVDFRKEQIFACRDGSPLVVGINGNEYFLASDVPPFLKYTNKVYFLKDGEGVLINKNGVELFDLRTEKNKKILFETIDWKYEDAEKCGFPHFLLKEIFEQKKTIEKTTLINRKAIETIADKINHGYKVIFAACGTAYYCGLAGKYFFAQNGVGSQVYGAYEFLPFSKFCDEKTLFVAISQSGETADTLIAVKEAKKNGAKILAIINARGSTLERLSDYLLPVSAGPEIAVISTKAFSSQLSTLYLLAKAVAGKYEEGVREIEELSKKLNSWLNTDLTDKITKIAKEIGEKPHSYVIGKGLNYPGGLEFALKIKETSYIHSEGFASGELKHGVIALIQKQTPLFVLSSNDQFRQEILSSASEVRARGGKIIGISPLDSKEFNRWIETPDVGDLTVIANVIVGQLLGYYLGIFRGTDPDKPRNLAKSVTVK